MCGRVARAISIELFAHLSLKRTRRNITFVTSLEFHSVFYTLRSCIASGSHEVEENRRKVGARARASNEVEIPAQRRPLLAIATRHVSKRISKVARPENNEGINYR